MNKNVVYYFTGTGNSLKVAKDIAQAIGDCDVISMGIHTQHNTDMTYETIGFVCPVYGSGLPRQVKKFITNMNIHKSKDAYYFAVATCGGNSGNTLPQINSLLTQKGVQLQYSTTHKMVSNYVGLYKMNKNNEAINVASNEKLPPLIADIKQKKQKPTSGEHFIPNLIYNLFNKSLSEKDKGFQVSSSCVNCGICKSICPVNNIEMKNKKPSFKHNCEQCMACIQWCPKEAINYKDKTQNRGRYHNPSIKHEELRQNKN